MKKLILAGMAALTLTTPLLADPGDWRGDRGGRDGYRDGRDGYRDGGYRGDRAYRDGYRAGRDRDYRDYYGRGWGRYPAGTRFYGERYADYGWGSYRRWNRGGYLPRDYYGERYIVDYDYYHLRRPPRGYGWVRYHDDALLVALSSGLIAEAIYGRRW